jgi:nitroimidazol reductase NimA-like FMN-containing flavoprotein (pyridoxamine 5'-phosphate oxidase superfamily)
MASASSVRPFEVLGDDECLQLLRSEPVGRMGLVAGALPVVLPVNFVLDGDRILFMTDPGLKLDAARCMEADGYDRWSHTGWSVLATGRLRELTDPEEIEVASEVKVRPWAHPYAQHWVELRIELLSGRRIGEL